MVVHISHTAQPVVLKNRWYWSEMTEAVQAKVPIFQVVAPALINLLTPDPGEL